MYSTISSLVSYTEYNLKTVLPELQNPGYGGWSSDTSFGGYGSVEGPLETLVKDLKVKIPHFIFSHQCPSPQAFPHLTSLIGMEGIFFLHSSTLLLGAAFALAVLPETRNKSLTQLEQIFVEKKEGQENAGYC